VGAREAPESAKAAQFRRLRGDSKVSLTQLGKKRKKKKIRTSTDGTLFDSCQCRPLFGDSFDVSLLAANAATKQGMYDSATLAKAYEILIWGVVDAQ